VNQVETAVQADARIEPTEGIPHQRRNFLVMVAHMVLHRMGWIFKLESVVIPTFVGTLTKSPYALSALPLLNRIGRRLPPLIGGRIAYGRPRLRGLMVVWMGGFTLIWGVVAAALWLAPPERDGGFVVPFFVAYGLSYLFVGISQVTRGALVGRLIPTRRRGAYVGLSSLLGGLAAVPIGLAIWHLMRDGTSLEPRQFAPVFTCAFVFFALATLTMILVRERGTAARAVVSDRRVFWRRVGQVLRQDRNFRRLVVAVLLLQVHGYVFPFYIRLGRDAHVITDAHLGLLILVQNVSLAVSTLLMGRLADRGGHKRVLIICFGVTMCVPVFAVAACRLPHGVATVAYLFVFVLIGFGPSLQRFLANYVLEISTPADHAVYLSTFETLQLATILYAPVVGLIASGLSIACAMLGAAAVMAVGLLVALRLAEPRHHPPIAPEEVPVMLAGNGEI